MVCARNGRCTVDATTHTCVARNPADCAVADVCVRGGRETISQLDTRICGARPDVDMCTSPLCARTSECALRGNCAAIGGTCAPTEPAHCQRSIDCRVRGECSYRPYSCYANTQPDCDVSYECRAYGRCKFTPKRLSLTGQCMDPAVGEDHKDCVNEACYTAETCLRTKTDACVTPAAEGLPPLRPPEPPRLPRMQAGVDDRSFAITHVLARQTRTSDHELAVELRLSARPLDCDVFKTPAAPTFRVLGAIDEGRPGYVEVANEIHSVQWGTSPAITTNRSARFDAAPTLGLTPTLVEIDIDTNALPNRTISLHGDLLAQPCPP
jgi:hypothetical protein